MVDTTAFAPGRNMAMTPGKVVYRNRLIELIQYEPTTKTVHAVPIMIMPPWINKYYILDLQPKNSMVRHLVEQGFTVFVVVLEEPGRLDGRDRLRGLHGPGPAGGQPTWCATSPAAPTVNAMGYCIGGTLLITTLAWLATQGDKRFNSATFMVSMQDFSQGRRHRHLHGRGQDRLHRAADDGAGLSRQPRDVQHVQPAALQRPDLVERRQQLPDGREAAGLRPAVLEQRRHPHVPRRPQLVPAQHLCREQPDRAGQDRRSRASRSTSA